MESMYLESLNDYKATSNDGKFFVKTLGKIFENFQNKFENILVLKLDELKTQYVELINVKNEEIRKLKDKVDSLEEKCDEAEAYSRRDCIIVSGDDIPTETASENTSPLCFSSYFVASWA